MSQMQIIVIAVNKVHAVSGVIYLEPENISLGAGRLEWGHISLDAVAFNNTIIASVGINIINETGSN